MLRSRPQAPASLVLWILFCAFCNCAGWALSALHQLNAAGYLAVFTAGAVAVLAARNQLFRTGGPPLNVRKLQRRFRRPFPLVFLVLAVLAILGGVLYPPGNADGLTHRIPRLLNWLAEGRWHWIHNGGAMNSRPCGFEWIMGPMIALARTDRWVFVYNAISFLLLPGLLFGVLRRLGVRGRVAWHWMWIAPSGYCFVLQAGSIGNDAAGAVFALAAVYFALRARQSRSHQDLWLSLLSAGLMTAVKSSNLALLLPWLLALLPSLRLLLARPAATVAAALVALSASFLPTGLLNAYYVGDWSAISTETPRMQGANPVILVAGNLLNLALQNLAPPVFPWAQWWNTHAHRALPPAFIAEMENVFEPGGAHFSLPEIQYEPIAGLGMGVTTLLLMSWVIAAILCPRGGARFPQSGDQWLLALVRWSPFVVLAAFTLKTAMSTSARIIAPYYCFFLPFFLTGAGWDRLVRSRAWQCCALLLLLPALVLVVLNPPRPLWPAQTVLSGLAARRPQARHLELAASLYSAYATRWDALAGIRKHLPDDEKKIGFLSLVPASSLEASLWRPYGQRRIIRLLPEDSAAQIAALGIRYVAVGTDPPPALIQGVPCQEWIQAWCQARGGRIVGSARARHRATLDEAVWHVVEIGSPAAQPESERTVKP